ncbi:MAG TPA: glycosyltransferase family 87 protein [Anaerolineales bacterium]|nr:glycosyltransferase family 87 protein [Anaerolineales bacterium]
MSEATRFIEKLWGPILLGISILITVFTTALPSSKRITHGFAAYYTASRLILENRGGTIFYDDKAFQAQVEEMTSGEAADVFWANPPTMALIFMPLATLSIHHARYVWTLISLILLILGATLSGYVIFKTPFRKNEFYLSASIFFLSVPVTRNFQYGQVYIFLLVVYALALLALHDNFDWLAGVLLGFALALKASGLPLLVLFVLRGKWKLVVWTFIALAALAFLSLPLVGLSTWLIYLFEVIPKFLVDPVIAVIAYQTIPGFTRHLFTYDPVWNLNPLADWPTFASLVSLLITLAFVGIAGWRSRRTSLEWTFCIGLVLSLILVPAAEQHHYVILFPAFLLAIRSPNVSKWLLFIAAALIALPLESMNKVLSSGWWALLAYPRLYGAILLFFILHFNQNDFVSRDSQAINIDALSRA